MLPWDPTGKIGPKKPLPDNISIVEPKEEEAITGPRSETKGAKAPPPVDPLQVSSQPPMPTMPQGVGQSMPQ